MKNLRLKRTAKALGQRNPGQWKAWQYRKRYNTNIFSRRNRFAERYISLYEVERCYGGPEEGGWWFDWYTFLRTKKYFNGYFALKAMRSGKHQEPPYCRSVPQMHSYATYRETVPGQYETKQRPWYE